MNRNAGRPFAGFTLIEMLLVVAIIGILMGLVGAAAYAAHQRAYITRANTEAQQIAAAFKSYWVAKSRWPTGFGNGWTALTRGNLGPLMGTDKDGTVYLNVPPESFVSEKDDDDGTDPDAEFLDPWGNPYAVRIDEVVETSVSDTIEGAVSFPNFMRHYYEEGVYTESSSDWKETWDRCNR